jgi:hypothetical protein
VHSTVGTCIADEHKARGRQHAGATHTGASCIMIVCACLFKCRGLLLRRERVHFIKKVTPRAPTKTINAETG